MILPNLKQHFTACIQVGRYVLAKLRQFGRHDLADEVAQVTTVVQDAGRAMEDAQGPIQEAIALRDAAESDLQEIAKVLRLKLAARSLDAMVQPPYTRIFNKGIATYVRITLDEVHPKFRQLRSRVEVELGDDDPLRAETINAITDGLEQYAAAENAVADARNAASLARTRCEAVREEWHAVMTKVYAALLVEVGKTKANSFFPKSAKRKKSDKEAEAKSAPANEKKAETPKVTTPPLLPAPSNAS